MTWFLTAIIKGYQNLGRVLSLRACRFYPSCSQYALEAILKYGAFRGGIKSILRVLRCSPVFPGGYDPLT